MRSWGKSAAAQGNTAASHRNKKQQQRALASNTSEPVMLIGPTYQTGWELRGLGGLESGSLGWPYPPQSRLVGIHAKITISGNYLSFGSSIQVWHMTWVGELGLLLYEMSTVVDIGTEWHGSKAQSWCPLQWTFSKVKFIHTQAPHQNYFDTKLVSTYFKLLHGALGITTPLPV